MTSILYEIHEQLYGSKFYERYVAARCLSPDHEDKHPSMIIYPDKFYCQACGFTGKTKDLLKQLQSHSLIPVKETKQTVRNPFNRWLKGGELLDVLKSAYRALKSFPQQGKYLRDRKLSDELIQKLKFGYSEGFYTIPIIDMNKDVTGAIARAGSSIEGARYFVPHGQDTNLLFSPDWNQVNESKEVWLTFGVFDAIAIYQCGRPSMSTTSGKRIHPSAFQDIRKRIKIFPDKREEIDAKRLANKLGWRGEVITCLFPTGMKDASDLHQVGLLERALQ